MRGLALALAAGFTLAAAHAQGPAPSPAPSPAPGPAPSLAILGQVAHPTHLTLAELQALPAVSVTVAHVSGKGAQSTSRYTGALLWPLLDAAAPTDAGPRTRLQHTLLATGRDGYAVALAIGELMPDFEGKQVLLAYAEDGKPLADLRLVVPGDAKAGRSVRDLVSLELR